MSATYVQADAAPVPSLPADLESIRAQGVIKVPNRIYLKAYAAARHPVPPSLDDDWSAERWVNNIALDSNLEPSDPAWRPQLVAWGLVIVGGLLPQAAALCSDGRAMQAAISLQSAAGRAEPDLDFATGALHIYSVRSPADDLSIGLEQDDQPCMTITTVA